MRAIMVGLGRIAWKGFGKPGIETHLDALPTVMDLAAGVDIDSSSRRAFQERTGAHVYDSLGEALEREQPQVVVVCTPPEAHHSDVVTAFLHPGVRGVICEKPMAPTVRECGEMIEVSNGRPLLIAHQRRWEVRHQAVAGFLRSGKLGNLFVGQAWFSGDYLNNGTHAADVCRMLIGDSNPWEIKRGDGFGVTVTADHGSITLASDGKLAPGYMRSMYGDLVTCIEHPGQTPICSGEDGMEAVRHALYAAERDEHAA